MLDHYVYFGGPFTTPYSASFPMNPDGDLGPRTTLNVGFNGFGMPSLASLWGLTLSPYRGGCLLILLSPSSQSMHWPGVSGTEVMCVGLNGVSSWRYFCFKFYLIALWRPSGAVDMLGGPLSDAAATILDDSTGPGVSPDTGPGNHWAGCSFYPYRLVWCLVYRLSKRVRPHLPFPDHRPYHAVLSVY